MAHTIVAVALVFGCLSASAAWAATGVAELRATVPGSPIQGTVQLVDTPKGLKLTVQISSAPAGPHGFHIHEWGSCADSGNAAGGHFNPSKQPHGHVIQDGPHKAHAGDLGNLIVDPSGYGSTVLVVPGVTLAGSSFPVGGRAIIVHEHADDFSQPVGNAGGRIACGPILITGD